MKRVIDLNDDGMDEQGRAGDAQDVWDPKIPLHLSSTQWILSITGTSHWVFPAVQINKFKIYSNTDPKHLCS